MKKKFCPTDAGPEELREFCRGLGVTPKESPKRRPRNLAKGGGLG